MENRFASAAVSKRSEGMSWSEEWDSEEEVMERDEEADEECGL